ncbi:MAG TPA: TonB-dependent receptor [Longimicrobium sp.]|nr:TonB-dependent receptor [Longimicrobium sp.]
MRWTRVLALCAALLCPVAAHAQGTGTVTGTVLDDQTGRPLSDVVITVNGTARRAVTDAAGRFNLTAVPVGARTVSASRPGYTGTANVTVAAGQGADVTIRMRAGGVQLQGVVAVGYGTLRRRDVTGAVSSVSTEALRNTPVASLDQVLQGAAPGVQVTSASSTPGGGISIRVRGTSSITGNSEPLYVIDGFPIENDPEAASPGNGGRATASVPSNPMASLNPNDIESIEVLKDASATAIYGARGANGVVIITTKRGRAGRPQVSIDSYTGMQTVIRRYDLLTSRELAQAMNEVATNGGGQPIFSQAALDTLGRGTDWQDAIFRSAPIRSVQGSVSGGSAGTTYTRYAVSGGFFNQEGVVTGSDFKRYSLRANLEQGIGPRFRFGTNLAASRVNTSFVPTDGESNRRAGAVGAALQAYPFLPVQFSNGTYPFQGRDLASVGVPTGNAAELVNPVSLATQVMDDQGDTRLLGNAYTSYEILRGLTARVSVGGDYADRYRNTYFPRTTRTGLEAPNGQAIRGTSRILSVLNENTLTWDGDIGEHSHLNVLGGFTWQTNVTERTSVSGVDFVTDVNGFNAISSARVPGTPSSNREKWALQSFLGRVNYSLLDRYLVTLTGRTDGSSRFGRGSKWGFFPSAALGWHVSEERFLRDVDAISDLKLRASYGVAGNPSIRPYQSLARLISAGYSFGGNPATGYFPVGVANDELTWESTRQLDIGFDLGLFDRVSVTADYYVKTTDNLLLTVDLPSESGFARALVNAGSIENRGVELSLNVDVLEAERGSRRLGWRSSLNFARNRNKVTDLGEDAEITSSTISDDFKLPGTVVRVGQPVGVFIGYQTAGIVRDSAHAASLAGITNRVGAQPFRAGDVLLVDVDANDTIDARDRTVIGNPNPDFTLGWQNTLSFGGFELSGMLQGAFGNDILNLNRWRLTGGDVATNLLRDRYEQRWTPQNTNAKYPRLGVNTVGAGTTDYNDLILEDGSYLRLKTLSLAYQFPARWLSARGVTNARVYVTGSNLVTWTDYTGFDPEVSSFGVGNLNRGIDIGAYPAAKSVTFGLNFTY